MQAKLKEIAIAVLAVSLLAPAAFVRAENPGNPTGGQFARKHPRRNEVNERVRNQRRMLNQQLKSGKITRQQYNDQMAALKNVKNQEHADVKANGGHITRQQQGALNQELNQNREQIKDNTQAAPPPAAPASGQ